MKLSGKLILPALAALFFCGCQTTNIGYTRRNTPKESVSGGILFKSNSELHMGSLSNGPEYPAGTQVSGLRINEPLHFTVDPAKPVSITGMELGIFNSCNLDSALQLGVVNLTSAGGGTQIGVVNVSRNASGVQFGLFNYMSSSYIPFMILINWGSTGQ